MGYRKVSRYTIHLIFTLNTVYNSEALSYALQVELGLLREQIYGPKHLRGNTRPKFNKKSHRFEGGCEIERTDLFAQNTRNYTMGLCYEKQTKILKPPASTKLGAGEPLNDNLLLRQKVADVSRCSLYVVLPTDLSLSRFRRKQPTQGYMRARLSMLSA